MHLVCFCGGDGEDRFAIRVRDLRGMLTMVGPEMTDLPGLGAAIVGLWLAIRGLGAEGLNYDDMEKLDEAEQLKHVLKLVDTSLIERMIGALLGRPSISTRSSE